MIIKLAAFTREEENKIRENLKNPSGIKSKQLLLNYTHPAVILGGATGGFAGSEIGDKIFGGSHMVDSFAGHAAEGAKQPGVLQKLIGAFKKPVPTQVAQPVLGLSGRYAKNLFRGGVGAIGAGIGAYGVAKYRAHKEKKK